ncbi:hypothetical protein DSM106972_011860 [Dulcicalothrix desertica PCC 7102]|uniref:Uncharacterized protein n=1 Tax=Dulcicalothrix desertica PCC 7102 TaxID=232991 RepID=A0A3S1AUB2_9CYAN|nr:hypothetical protein [Dulcicalothrix desertica]RUT09133.1 hypothetical protein DSM106972_011860 [Dulcicalothrix desertica PCC 7102]
MIIRDAIQFWHLYINIGRRLNEKMLVKASRKGLRTTNQPRLQKHTVLIMAVCIAALIMLAIGFTTFYRKQPIND